MRDMREPEPVKLFAATILRPETGLREELLQQLACAWGPIDDVHGPTPFDKTDYYEPEMGCGLLRLFSSFERLRPADSLPDITHQAAALEADFADVAGCRRVNVDVGYLDYHKVVLASTKQGPAKIYMGRGIWADLTMRYSRGTFSPFPWTFPDFADGRYDAFLLRARTRYRQALRARRTGY